MRRWANCLLILFGLIYFLGKLEDWEVILIFDTMGASAKEKVQQIPTDAS